MAQNAGPQLIPGLRNEISDLVLHQLAYHELITAYFVSPAWQDAIDDDNVLRKRMFRLPKSLAKAGHAERTRFVRGPWQNIRDRLPDGSTDLDLWENVAINPLYDPDRVFVDDDGYRLMFPSAVFDLERLPHVPDLL